MRRMRCAVRHCSLSSSHVVVREGDGLREQVDDVRAVRAERERLRLERADPRARRLVGAGVEVVADGLHRPHLEEEGLEAAVDGHLLHLLLAEHVVLEEHLQPEG